MPPRCDDTYCAVFEATAPEVRLGLLEEGRDQPYVVQMPNDCFDPDSASSCIELPGDESKEQQEEGAEAASLLGEEDAPKLLSDDVVECVEDAGASKRRVLRTPFTYWISAVLSLVFFASLSIHGIDEFTLTYVRREAEVLALDQTPVTVRVSERGNAWIGPREADLIRLGARYSPCMREEKRIREQLERDKEEESLTGCCVHPSGVCYQAGGEECPHSMAVLYRHRHWKGDDARRRRYADALTLEDTRKSQIVCALDPDFCEIPSWHAFAHDITLWPKCRERVDELQLRGFLPRHMTCRVVGRPCCMQLQGRCRITTREYCNFVRGTFHEDAFLCSQVSCLAGVCGGAPNQIYRLFTSLFLHAGVLHLRATLFLQLGWLRRLEGRIGWWRVGVIYFVAGMGANAASALVAPFKPEVGPTGALAGISVALLLQEQSTEKRRWRVLRVCGGFIVALAIAALLPWVGVWTIVFGALFGALAAMVVDPEGIRDSDGRLRPSLLAAAFSLVVLTELLLYLFIAGVDIHCE